MQLHSPPTAETATPTVATPQESPSESAATPCPVDLEHELTKGFTAKMIRRKAKQLVGHFGYTASDRKDLEQELKLALLERLEQFNPKVANWEAFATMVVDRRIATIIEERWAEKREYRHSPASLATLVKDPDGELVELSTQLGEEHLERLTGIGWPHHEQESALAHDIEAVLANLPADLRDLCERLKRQTVLEISRETGIPRTNVYRMRERLRELFRAEGFSG